jgi:hypothetical protein
MAAGSMAVEPGFQILMVFRQPSGPAPYVDRVQKSRHRGRTYPRSPVSTKTTPAADYPARPGSSDRVVPWRLLRLLGGLRCWTPAPEARRPGAELSDAAFAPPERCHSALIALGRRSHRRRGARAAGRAGDLRSARSAPTALPLADCEIGIGDTWRNDSIAGTTFTARAIGDVAEGVLTEVSGTAFRTGEHRFVLEPRDTLETGFVLR